MMIEDVNHWVLLQIRSRSPMCSAEGPSYLHVSVVCTSVWDEQPHRVRIVSKDVVQL